ncbi:hypothetical protein ACTFIZ_006596 [Dictyostelium cf. discoideum]
MDNNSSTEGFKLEKLPFQYFSITELLKVKDEPYTWITEDGCRIIKHFLILKETLVVVEYTIDSRSNHTTIFKLPNYDMVDLKYSSSFITEENIKRWGPTDHKLDKNRWADGDSINKIIDFINLKFNIENLVNHSTYHHLLLKNFNEENKNKLKTFRLCNIPLLANGNHWCLLTFKNLNNGFFQPVLINSLNGHPDIVETVLDHYKRIGFKFNDLLVISLFSQKNFNDCGVFLIIYIDFLNRLTINEEDYIFKINNQNINKLEENFYKLYCGKSKAITQEIINIWRKNVKEKENQKENENENEKEKEKQNEKGKKRERRSNYSVGDADDNSNNNVDSDSHSDSSSNGDSDTDSEKMKNLLKKESLKKNQF